MKTAWDAVGCIILIISSQAAVGMTTNPDFAGGLTGWGSEGSVTTVGEVAVLGDDFPESALYQGVATGPGNFVLEFDFLGTISSDLSMDPFAFPDTFFASILFIDDLSQFDLGLGIYDDSVALFDMDDLGVFSTNPNAVIDPSALGGDWRHFSLAFNSAYTYAIPTFEFFDFNFVIGDSEVLLDNVTLTPSQAPIPEPATTTLLLTGLVGCVIRQRFTATMRSSGV